MNDLTDPLRNPKDPLRPMLDPLARELVRRFGKAADGFSAQQAIDAAASIIITALRQTWPTKDKAEERINEIMGKTKQAVLDQYDGRGKRKEGVFVFDQVIEMPFVDFRKMLGK